MFFLRTQHDVVPPTAAFILQCTWHLADNNRELKLTVSSTDDNCSSVCSTASQAPGAAKCLSAEHSHFTLDHLTFTKVMTCGRVGGFFKFGEHCSIVVMESCVIESKSVG